MLLSSSVHAIDMTYGMDVSLGRYENINRVSNPVREEWVQRVRGVFKLVENSSNLIANVDASLSIINYSNNQQQDDVSSNVNALGRWIIKPKQFEWILSDVYTQTIINQFQSINQSNIQNINVFSTGPNFFLRFNSRNNINFEARVNNVFFENTGGDNNQLSTAIRWLYLTSPALTTSLNAELEKTDYIDIALNDYTRNDAFARFYYKKANSVFAAEAGLTKVEYNNQRETLGKRYLLSVQQQRTSNSDFQLVYRYGLTDTGSFLSSAVLNPLSNSTLSTSLVPDVFTLEELNFNYNKKGKKFSFNISVNQNKFRYENQTALNQHGASVSISPIINISQVSSLRFEAKNTKTTYDNQNPIREDLDYLYRAVYSYKSSKKISLSLSLESEKRKSTNVASSYNDNRIIASLIYTPR